MDSTLPILSLSAAAAVSAAALFPKLKARLALSRAKHRSLTGHSKMSKMVARLVPHYEFDLDDFFRSDGAPADISILAPDLAVTVSAKAMQSKSKNTPFDGWTLRGGVAATVVGGRAVYVNDQAGLTW